ncbi:unnamed protein product [Arabidopsis halleri]
MRISLVLFFSFVFSNRWFTKSIKDVGFLGCLKEDLYFLGKLRLPFRRFSC